jgi:hypothetical protein
MTFGDCGVVVGADRYPTLSPAHWSRARAAERWMPAFMSPTVVMRLRIV